MQVLDYIFYHYIYITVKGVCVATYLLLGLVFGPRCLAIFLTQCLFLLVVQQRVMLVVADDLIFVTVKQFCEDRILGQRGKRWVNIHTQIIIYHDY